MDGKTQRMILDIVQDITGLGVRFFDFKDYTMVFVEKNADTSAQALREILSELESLENASSVTPIFFIRENIALFVITFR